MIKYLLFVEYIYVGDQRSSLAEKMQRFLSALAECFGKLSSRWDSINVGKLYIYRLNQTRSALSLQRDRPMDRRECKKINSQQPSSVLARRFHIQSAFYSKYLVKSSDLFNCMPLTRFGRLVTFGTLARVRLTSN